MAGPWLVTDTVNVMGCPSSGVISSIFLVMDKSTICGSTLTCAILLPRLVSERLAAVMEATLRYSLGVLVGGFTFPVRVRVRGVAFAMVPTLHCPVLLLYVPCEVLWLLYANPAGRTSVTITSFTGSEPETRVSVMVNVTSSPTNGVGLSTVLVTPRSTGAPVLIGSLNVEELLADTGSGL